MKDNAERNAEAFQSHEQMILNRRGEFITALSPVAEELLGERGILEGLMPNQRQLIISTAVEGAAVTESGRLPSEAPKEKQREGKRVVIDPLEERFNRRFRAVRLSKDQIKEINADLPIMRDTLRTAYHMDYSIRP